MSSTLLTLVNKVLVTSGDSSPVTTVTGSVGGIAERITEFLNLTIGAIENRTNWAALRVNASGLASGNDDVFDFIGLEDVRSGGAVSVWIANKGLMQELTPEQFDTQLALQSNTGNSLFFQRGTSVTDGKFQIQLYPTPANGDVISVSAYKRATRFDSAVDTSTTEFDDDILVLGALMHLDSYDGLNRGYAALYQDQLNSDVMANMSNRGTRVEVDGYQ